MVRLRFLIILICAILASNMAHSAFTTARISGSKGLVVTPVADLLERLQGLLNTQPVQLLTNRQLQDLNVNVDAYGGYPLDDHELRYITWLLTNRTFEPTQSGFQSVFDSSVGDNTTACPNADCGRDAADWLHEQISEGYDSDIYLQWSLITISVLDDLIGIPGYTAAVLGASGADISGLYTHVPFRFIGNSPGRASRPNSEAIRESIAYVAGFTPAIAVDPINFTLAEAREGRILADAFYANTDRANFTLATYLACYNNTEVARSGGANVCNITAAAWNQRSSQLTYFTEAKTALSQAGAVLTEAQIANIGLTLPTTPSPLPDYARTYLSAQFKLQESATNPSEWQAILNAYNDETAARWYLVQVRNSDASSGSTRTAAIDMIPSGTASTVPVRQLPTTSVTEAVLLAAGMTSTALTDTGATLAEIQQAFLTSDLSTLAAITPAAIDAFIIEAAGFGEGTTLADIRTATSNGWTLANYERATQTPGNTWTTSQEDMAAYTACLASTEPLTGEAGACTVSRTAWVDGLNVITSANAPSDLTSDNLEALLAASRVQDINSAFGDLTSLTPLEAAYLTDCMGTSLSTVVLDNCVVSAVATSVPIYNVAQKLSGANTEALTVSDLQATDIATYEAAPDNQSVFDFLALNTCGANGNQPCSDFILGNHCGASGTSPCGQASLVSAGRGASQVQILLYAQSAVLNYSQRQVDQAALPTGQSGQRCSGLSIPAPHPCGDSNPVFSCEGVDGWTYTYTSGGTGTLSKASLPLTGALTAKVRITRGAWWGGNGYSRVVTTPVTLSAAAPEDTTYGYLWQEYGRSPSSMRRAQQNCTSGGGTVLDWATASAAGQASTSRFSFYPAENTSGNSAWDRDIGRYYSAADGVLACQNVTMSGTNNPSACNPYSFTSPGGPTRVMCRAQLCN